MSVPAWRALPIACLFGAMIGGELDSAEVQPSPHPSGAAIEPEKSDANSGVALTSAIKWAKEQAAFLENNVSDYSATLYSRERIEGRLGGFEVVALKVRHRPFSVYARIVSPEDRKGNEALFVEGKYDNQLMVHAAKGAASFFGTIALDPNSSMAMKGRRHPISEIGVLSLCRGVIRYAESDRNRAESQTRILRDAKINGRPCTVLEIQHPFPRQHFEFHLLRLFVDDQLKIPVRYEQYDWPQEAGRAPLLMEEYTYVNVKLNNGFTDHDFDPKNPEYTFP